MDDYKSAKSAAKYLVEKGYKKIFHLAGPKELGICVKRRDGYVEALKESGLPFNNDSIRYGGLHEEDGYNSMKYLVENKIIPDAIFAVNDPVAIGAYQMIREAGLKIPNDVAILGFSNNKIATLIDPQLTTVDQPSFEMGKKAAEILISTIQGNITEPQSVNLETKLMIRGST